MQELRLVGVQEDGNHLLLSSEQGVSFRLPIDDALRRASASSPGAGEQPLPTAVEQHQAQTLPEKPRARPTRAPVHLTPRDIQARIRAGASAEQVAEESGLELSHVQRYEGPVRAERDWVAYLAQRVEVASPLPSHDGYRSAFGDSPALLGDMVAFRVQEFGMDQAELEWDSWRRADGSWHVEVAFDLPEDSRVDLGEQPPARWNYNPTRKTVTNANRWAQVLSELEPLDGPLPPRRLSAVADRVFDFEADRAEPSSPAPDSVDAGSPDASSPDTDQDGLLDVLRSRRGQRLGTDEDGDDALAELLTRGSIPAAHPRAEDAPDAGNAEDEPQPGAAGLSLAPRVTGQDDETEGPGAAFNQDGTPRLYEGVSTETREISIFAHPARGPQRAAQRPAAKDAGREVPDDREDTSASDAATTSVRDARGRSGRDAGQGAGTGTDRDPQKGADSNADKDGAEQAADRRPKPKRSSVPSWDDIVFGRRSD